VLALVATAVNFIIDLSLAPKGIPVGLAVSGSVGAVSVPYILAGILMFWKQHRNLHSFFRAAAIISVLLFFSYIGKVGQPVKG
jgi:hypothetical protein